jgi:hypothetical protein
MAWQTLSIHFKQTFKGGWRYLDHCGEFMLAACDSMDFMAIEAKPTSAALDIPERGISAGVDSAALVVTQELPEDSGEFFLKIFTGMSSLADYHFKPQAIITNGLATKSLWPTPDAEKALASTLKLGDSFGVDLAKAVNMVSAFKKLDYNFASGSLELHVVVQAVTFEKISLTRHNPSFQASPYKRREPSG